MVTTADQREINNFAALSDHWWDARGPMAPLHAFTPIRVDYILASVERFWPLKTRPIASASYPLTGLRILDIGCGGGLLSEPMARLGATMTGIDVTETAIMAAITHTRQAGLDIDYRCCTAEEMASNSVSFDVSMHQKIEHAHTVAYLSKRCQHVIQRSSHNYNNQPQLASFVASKICAGIRFPMVPIGTMTQNLAANELRQNRCGAYLLDDITGSAPRPGGD